MSMIQTPSPIRRSKQLAALSREHHDSLLFVWKINQGMACGISAKRIASYCKWYRDNYLWKHFRKEEMALSKALPVYDVLMKNMIEDHEVISSQIEQAIQKPSYISLKFLAQIVYYHVRFEERTLFPHIEKTATAEALEQAASLLQNSEKITAIWSDEFWLGPSEYTDVPPPYAPIRFSNQ